MGRAARLGGCETYSWQSSRQRALEAAPLSRSSATWSTGTTGVKTTAESLEQVDAVGSAVGTARIAVRRSISESRDVYRLSQVCSVMSPNSTLGERFS